MKTSDILLAIIIIFIFVGIYMFNILTVGIENIKKNWPVYRCNPTVMPFADKFGHDAKENFDYCIQNMQSDYMNYLLEPINYSIDLINQSAANSNFGLQGARNMMSNMRFMSADIFQNIFGVFLNTLIVFQTIIIKMRDMLGKVVGVIASMMYILQGSFQTMDSAWKGPMGGLVRSLA